MKNDESTFKKEFTRGVAARAPGYFWIRLVGWTTEFRAFVRVDIGVGPDVDVKFSFFFAEPKRSCVASSRPSPFLTHCLIRN